MRTPTAYPLTWPDGWPRTPLAMQRNSINRWGRHEGGKKKRPWTFREAVESLLDELDRMGAKNAVVSSNFKLTVAGLPSRSFGRPEDQGIAVWFELHGKPMAMAQDGHTRAEENVRSLTLALKYMRGLEENGGGVMMERAFRGFAALPSPARQDWRATLGLGPDASLEDAERAYRAGVKQFHPDRPTGDAEQFHKINRAIEQARKEA